MRLGGAFRLCDTFLKFLSIDFLEKCTTRIEEKIVEIVNGLSEGGVVQDRVAFFKHDIETVVEKCVNFGGNGGTRHKYLHGKGKSKLDSTLYNIPPDLLHTPQWTSGLTHQKSPLVSCPTSVVLNSLESAARYIIVGTVCFPFTFRIKPIANRRNLPKFSAPFPVRVRLASSPKLTSNTQ